jgi:hypothetical protein
MAIRRARCGRDDFDAKALHRGYGLLGCRAVHKGTGNSGISAIQRRHLHGQAQSTTAIKTIIRAAKPMNTGFAEDYRHRSG